MISGAETGTEPSYEAPSGANFLGISAEQVAAVAGQAKDSQEFLEMLGLGPDLLFSNSDDQVVEHRVTGGNGVGSFHYKDSGHEDLDD